MLLPELLVAQPVDLARVFAVQIALEAEIFAQLHMTPVIERIADGVAEAFGPLDEPLLIWLRAGDIPLLDTARAHEAPLVVVAEVTAADAQPQLRDIVIRLVLADLPRVDMTVIIDNWQIAHALIERLCRRAVQKEILIHKLLHSVSPFCCKRSTSYRPRGAQTPEYAENPPSTGTTMPVTKPDARASRAAPRACQSVP